MNSNYLARKEKEETNQIKQESQLKKIRSKYILQQALYNLKKKKLLNIVKYNKEIQKRADINLKDYQEYSETYSSIIFEIKPINNGYGNFIKITKEDEIYYHIYFNNNKEEIKRKYIKKDEQIEIIRIIIDWQISSFKYLFYGCYCIESINFKQFSRNNIKDMNNMFDECSSLKELNINNFKTDKVTNMSFMFCDCASLKELNLNNFNTNKVIDMSDMFFGCSSLKEINLNNFITNNVINMSDMFCGCSSLKELDLNNFNTNKVH